jgi:small conductance mechanosensitive channel
MNWLTAFSSEASTHVLVRVSFLLFLAGIAFWVNRIAVERLKKVLTKDNAGSEQSKRVETGTRLIQSTVTGLIITLLGLEVLSELGINLAPLLAAAGIGGLAIGFGAQTLIKDLISGFFLLFENQVRIGDVVNVGGNSGFVESMGFRVLTLRDLHGNVHVIPNGSIDRVINMTRDYSRYVFDIGVSYREDPDEVMAILRKIGDEIIEDPEFAPDILEPLEMLGVDRFEDSAVVIRCRITTKPIKQWRVGREFNRRLKKALDKHGIEIPFPHRTIYMGDPKKTRPFPLHVSVDQAAVFGAPENETP